MVIGKDIKRSSTLVCFYGEVENNQRLKPYRSVSNRIIPYQFLALTI